jgi:predicted Ser/Thr protein kinase
MNGSLVDKTILDQFRVDAFLASGGMSTVYRVWDLKRNATLAMKVLHADLAEEQWTMQRLEREALALEKLTHPNIVPFYGLRKIEDSLLLLEQYIDGPTLKEILRKKGKKALSIAETLAFLRAVTSALGYAHANGVVHCDVKPGNVMVDRGGMVYLADFGIMRHAESTATTLGVAGTPAYMAPEQCRGEAVTAQTDVYALGAMLFEMLTGQRPFRGNEKGTEVGGTTPGARVCYAHLHLPPPNPRKLNSAIPAELAKVVMKAMAKKPAQRYASARALFEAACAAAGVDTRDVPERVTLPEEFLKAEKKVPVPQGRTKLGGKEPAAPAAKPTRRRKSPWVLAGIVLGIVVVMGATALCLLSPRLWSALGLGAGSSAVQTQTAMGPGYVATAAAQTVAAVLTDAHLHPTGTLPPAQATGEATPASTSTIDPHALWQACPGAPLSRLRVGTEAMVSFDPPLANRVREFPNTSADVLGMIDPGEQVSILEGPACSSGWVWWRVRTSWGLVGWTAEGDDEAYWLVPAE